MFSRQQLLSHYRKSHLVLCLTWPGLIKELRRAESVAGIIQSKWISDISRLFFHFPDRMIGLPDQRKTESPAYSFKREPRALTSEYHKARKQLMLWAAILFIWELIGIDLERAQQSGGNAGAIIGAIRSPQAVPWALLILVGYFAFKLRIEWRQCSESRREVREAKIDYYSACIVAAAASILYFAQAISHIQVVDALQKPGAKRAVIFGAYLGLAVTMCVTVPITWRVVHEKLGLLRIRAFFLLTIVALLVVGFAKPLKPMSISASIVFCLTSGLFLISKPWRPKRDDHW